MLNETSVYMFVAGGLIVVGLLALWLLGRKAHQRRKRENAELEAKLQALSTRTFAVVIRTNKGAQTGLETAIIGQMVAAGLKVVHLDNSAAREAYSGKMTSIPEGTLLVVGTAETTHGNLQFGSTDWLDMRTVALDGSIKAASNFNSYSNPRLAYEVICYLAKALSEK